MSFNQLLPMEMIDSGKLEFLNKQEMDSVKGAPNPKHTDYKRN